MIRPNTPFQASKDSPDQAAKRFFTKILRAAKPYWDEYSADIENHTARGLLSSADKAHKAELSFDDQEKHITLMTRLPLKNELDIPRQRCLFRFQNRPHGLASVILDSENNLLLVIACSVLPDTETANMVVSRVVSRLLDVLEDDDLQHIAN